MLDLVLSLANVVLVGLVRLLLQYIKWGCSHDPTTTIKMGRQPARDDLASHHRQLEAQLDSVLATLTLIHELGPMADPCAYSPRLLSVFHLISRGITSHTATAVPPIAPVPTPTTTQPVPSTAMATYATAVSDPRPVFPSTSAPESNTAKPLITKSPSSPSPPRATHTAERPTRVVIRIDREREYFQLKRRPHPVTLYNAVGTTLCPLSGMPHVKDVLAGLQWTRSGNIILHPATGVCTAKYLVNQGDTIWTALRPALGLSEQCKCPAFETDERWHSVVFHGVPIPPTDPLSYLTHRELVDGWVTSPSSKGELRDCAILCRPEELKKKKSLASDCPSHRQRMRSVLSKMGVTFLVSHSLPSPEAYTHLLYAWLTYPIQQTEPCPHLLRIRASVVLV
ncbi:hypothetical protein B0H13DRAFT_1915998 [Mycena leptocephala]|nr:hypothetical protein B0H13DRAFT_1915998 [Mycena leptocephala]